jgi:hypothetical protein
VAGPSEYNRHYQHLFDSQPKPVFRKMLTFGVAVDQVSPVDDRTTGPPTITLKLNNSFVLADWKVSLQTIVI